MIISQKGATKIINDLLGSNGKMVGSEEYFEKLLNGSLLGFASNQMREKKLHKVIDVVKTNVSKVVDELYADLKNNIRIIRYLSNDDRKRLIDMLVGARDLSKNFGGSGKFDECLRILNLSDYDTNPKSRASDREIEESVKNIKNGGSTNIAFYDRIDIIEKAIDWGEAYATGKDIKKIAYLKEVGKGKGEIFLVDVLIRYQFENNKSDFRGKCYKTLCSGEYTEYMEKQIFGREIPASLFSRSNRNYGEQIKSELLKISDSLCEDVCKADDVLCKMTSENASGVRNAEHQLKTLGIHTNACLSQKAQQQVWVKDSAEEANLIRINEQSQRFDVYDYAKKNGFTVGNITTEIVKGKDARKKLLAMAGSIGGSATLLFGEYTSIVGLASSGIGAGIAATTMIPAAIWQGGKTIFDSQMLLNAIAETYRNGGFKYKKTSLISTESGVLNFILDTGL